MPRNEGRFRAAFPPRGTGALTTQSVLPKPDVFFLSPTERPREDYEDNAPVAFVPSFCSPRPNRYCFLQPLRALVSNPPIRPRDSRLSA